jgi:hypothetical protein
MAWILHVDWNSRLNATRSQLPCDYANEYTCLIYGPDTPSTIPYNSFSAFDVVDVVLTLAVATPCMGRAPHWFWITCLYLETQCVTYLFSTYQTATISGGRTGSNSMLAWSSIQAGTTELVCNLHVPLRTVQRSPWGLAVSTPKCRPRNDLRHLVPPRIQDEIRLKNRIMMQCRITMNTSFNAEVNRLNGSVTRHRN